MIAALKYTHVRDRLTALGVPTCTAMERILTREKDDISLQKIAKAVALSKSKLHTDEGVTNA